MISIIIPTYNEEKTIGDCLESLSKQTHKDLEIIVVDDGSVDKTLDEIRNTIHSTGSGSSRTSRGTKYEIRILKQTHKGAGSARNLGARHSRGEILVFVDADMTFDKDFIKNLIAPIEDGGKLGTFSKEEYLANKENVWAQCWNLNRGLPKDRMHPKNYPNHQPVFRAILKSEFEKVDGFNEKAGYMDDWSLSEKLGTDAVVAPSAIFYHNNPDSLKEVFIQSRWMAKRHYKLGVIGYLVALLLRSLPASIVMSSLFAFRFSLFAFFPFKLISDFGQFVGVLEYLSGKVSK